MFDVNKLTVKMNGFYSQLLQSKKLEENEVISFAKEKINEATDISYGVFTTRLNDRKHKEYMVLVDDIKLTRQYKYVNDDPYTKELITKFYKCEKLYTDLMKKLNVVINAETESTTLIHDLGKISISIPTANTSKFSTEKAIKELILNKEIPELKMNELLINNISNYDYDNVYKDIIINNLLSTKSIEDLQKAFTMTIFARDKKPIIKKYLNKI